MNQMRILKNTLAVMAMIGFMALVVHQTANAAPPGERPSKATNGATDILSTATAMWSASTVLSGRNSFALYNNGTQIIYCGWTSAVTTATGFPVGVGSSLSVDVTYNGTGDKMLYCINASGDQSSPNNTRWIQVK